MAQLIEFPRRHKMPAAHATSPPKTLQEAMDGVVLACLSLGTAFDGMIADLERSLTPLSGAFSKRPNGPTPEEVRKLEELRQQLARARAMVASVRRDLASGTQR